jgi:hypothetical protein
VWLTAFDYFVSSQIQLFSCDSEGSLYVFESGDSKKTKKDDDESDEVPDWRDAKELAFSLKEGQMPIHSNGIIQVLIV